MKIDFKRSLTDYGKVQRAIGSLKRNRAMLADTKTPSTLLNMGCGGNTKPDFCNLDYHWRPGVDVVWDVTRGLPFPDRYCGGIFTEHMIEHISFVNTRDLLRECVRVLKPGGAMRIVVPDGEIYLSEYAKHLRGEPLRSPMLSAIEGSTSGPHLFTASTASSAITAISSFGMPRRWQLRWRLLASLTSRRCLSCKDVTKHC